MAISSVAKNFRDGTITLADGTGTPITMTVQYAPGDISISPLAQGLTNHETVSYFDRGNFYCERKTTQILPTITFTAHATDYSDATEKTLPDICRKLGAFAAGVSGFGASADVWCIKTVTLTIEGTSYGDSADHTYVCTNVVPTFDFAEGDPNTFTFTGKICGTVTIT